MMVAPYPYPPHMKDINNLLHVCSSMWEPFCVALEPRPMQIECVWGHQGPTNLASKTSLIWIDRCGSNSMMAAPYPHKSHMKKCNHLWLCLKWMREAFCVA